MHRQTSSLGTLGQAGSDPTARSQISCWTKRGVTIPQRPLTTLTYDSRRNTGRQLRTRRRLGGPSAFTPWLSAACARWSCCDDWPCPTLPSAHFTARLGGPPSAELGRRRPFEAALSCCCRREKTVRALLKSNQRILARALVRARADVCVHLASAQHPDDLPVDSVPYTLVETVRDSPGPCTRPSPSHCPPHSDSPS